VELVILTVLKTVICGWSCIPCFWPLWSVGYRVTVYDNVTLVSQSPAEFTVGCCCCCCCHGSFIWCCLAGLFNKTSNSSTTCLCLLSTDMHCSRVAYGLGTCELAVCFQIESGVKIRTRVESFQLQRILIIKISNYKWSKRCVELHIPHYNPQTH